MLRELNQAYAVLSNPDLRRAYDLAHGLGMKVVAEGVDSDLNLSKVADLGCDVAQGFVIASPRHGDDFMQWLDNYGSKSLELEGVDTPGDRGSEQHYG